jgi:ribosomal protein S18 acetylase RimI-like enzyme
MEIKRIYTTERHLVVDLFNKYRVYYNQPDGITLADNYIRERLEKGESVVFVALENINGKDIPLGFTQLYPTYSSVRAVKNWILNDLFVEQQHRGKGIGGKLVHTAMQFAKENNARFVQLETGIDNYGAQRLYESIGFVKQEPDTDFFVYRVEIK